MQVQLPEGKATADRYIAGVDICHIIEEEPITTAVHQKISWLSMTSTFRILPVFVH